MRPLPIQMNPPSEGAELLTVKEGWTSIWLRGVYGRFTQATIPPEDGGGTVQACFDWYEDGDHGVEYQPGATASETKAGSTVEVNAVKRFE